MRHVVEHAYHAYHASAVATVTVTFLFFVLKHFGNIHSAPSLPRREREGERGGKKRGDGDRTDGDRTDGEQGKKDSYYISMTNKWAKHYVKWYCKSEMSTLAEINFRQTRKRSSERKMQLTVQRRHQASRAHRVLRTFVKMNTCRCTAFAELLIIMKDAEDLLGPNKQILK